MEREEKKIRKVIREEIASILEQGGEEHAQEVVDEAISRVIGEINDAKRMVSDYTDESRSARMSMQLFDDLLKKIRQRAGGS